MAISRWSPLKDIDDMLARYGELLGRGGAVAQAGGRSTEWAPTAEIRETPGHYLIKADLPEVKKDDIDITVRDGVITLKGERRFQQEQPEEKVHRVETFYGSFSRSFSLPADVDEAAITAECRDGVLRIVLPKAAEARPRQVKVQVD
jgi:HSP20 family protein